MAKATSPNHPKDSFLSVTGLSSQLHQLPQNHIHQYQHDHRQSESNKNNHKRRAKPNISTTPNPSLKQSASASPFFFEPTVTTTSYRFVEKSVLWRRNLARRPPSVVTLIYRRQKETEDNCEPLPVALAPAEIVRRKSGDQWWKWEESSSEKQNFNQPILHQKRNDSSRTETDYYEEDIDDDDYLRFEEDGDNKKESFIDSHRPQIELELDETELFHWWQEEINRTKNKPPQLHVSQITFSPQQQSQSQSAKTDPKPRPLQFLHSKRTHKSQIKSS